MKKTLKLVALACCLTAGISFRAGAEEKVVFQNKVNLRPLAVQAMSSSSFIQMPAKTGVSLEKMWTVNFSKEVTADKIDAIVVQKGTEFVPTTITINGTNKVIVKPQMPYTPNTQYSLKVFLNDGKKYNMNFTTEKGYRQADSNNNDVYTSAAPVSLGDKITGSIGTNNDKNDWYKLYVSKDSNINLTLTHNQGKDIQLFVYSKDGDSKDYILEDHWNSKSVRRINEGLAAGTYYIKVAGANEGTYNMDIDYENQNTENDTEDNDIYIKSNALNLNSTVTGHIGDLTEAGTRDSVDCYKFTLAKDGVVNLKLNHDYDKNIEMFLYGKDGDNKDYIGEDHWNSKSARNINLPLTAGTYYVKIKSDNYGTYTLNSTFTENLVSNDKENNDSYINALAINMNDTKTGHIGYLKDDNSKDGADWYKLVVDSDKEVNIDLQSKFGGNVKLYLYGENGNNSDYIAEDHWNSKSVRNIKTSIKKGVYYIKVEDDGYGDGYTLRTY